MSKSPSDRKFSCEVVTGTKIDCALQVRQRVYIEEFGFDFGGAGPRDEFDDRALHLLATTSTGEPVASLRFLDATARPFEIEEFLDLRTCIGPERHPAEITRLCIIAPYRKITSATFVHLAIFEAVLKLSGQLGVTDIIASTRPELRSFYEYLMFESYPDLVYYHPGIGNAAHTLIRLDLNTLAERYRTARPMLYRLLVAVLHRPDTVAPQVKGEGWLDKHN